MTNEEQNIAVAEFLGKKWHQPTPAEFDTGSYYQYAPGYGNDLNAMHEAVFKLPQHKKWCFSKQLRDVVSRFYVVWPMLSTERKNYYTENATASQRREALLKTIGKWHD